MSVCASRRFQLKFIGTRMWPGRGRHPGTFHDVLLSSVFSQHLQEEDREKFAKLGPFLEKVQTYARILKAQMETAKTSYNQAEAPKKPPSKPAPVSTRKGRGKRALDESSVPPSKRVKTDDTDNTDPEGVKEGSAAREEAMPAFKQPVLVTGAKLKEYQLEGVAWMQGLYAQGISGILGTC